MVLQRSWDILVMIFVYVRHKIAGRSPEPVVAIPKPQILPDVIPKDKLTIFNKVGFSKISETSFLEDSGQKIDKSEIFKVHKTPKKLSEKLEPKISNMKIKKTDSRVYPKTPDKPEIENSFIRFSDFANLPCGSQEVVEHSTSEFSAEFPKIYISTTQFEEQKRNIEIQHQCKMSQIKLESAENLKKSEMEFREQSAKEEEENEKELTELDRKIEEFERETKRMKEENDLEIRKMNMAFFQCLLIQKKWEMDEKEFSKFLDSIREPISRLKTRYSLFEKVLKAQKRVKRDVLKRELTSLHGSTYYAYQSVYEGWENVKKLSETFSERIFLFILLKTLINVSDKLFNILCSIDNFMNQKESLENIKEKLSTLDAMDIPQTWKLREQSEIEPSDTLNFAQSPRFYEISSNVKITEV